MRISFVLLFLCLRVSAASPVPALYSAAFESNVGQASSDVVFLSRTPGSAVCLTRFGVGLETSRGWMSLEFEGANPNPEIIGIGPQPTQVSYFTGSDPSHWKTGVPNYATVRYREIYPGIDAVFYRNAGQLEYDLIARPKADPRSIRLRLKGDGAIRFDQSGNLIFNGILLRRPDVYQDINGTRRKIRSSFRRIDSHRAAFRIASYDSAQTLTIDPVLTYSTHLGGSSSSDTTNIYGIAADSAGNAYVTGFTSALDFPTQHAAQSKYGGNNGDAFIAKISSDGSTLLYATYLGGSNTDQANAIVVDPAGNAYVTGVTESSDFPAVNPFQPSHHPLNASGGTGFVAKINADGSKLLFSSYLGGSGAENPSGIALDSAGAPYITGATYSSDFPVKNAFQSAPRTANGSAHAFVTKLQPDGSGLLYSTYLGGSAADQGMGIAVDPYGSAYVTGYTQSPDFPAKNAFRSTPPGTAGPYTGYPPTAFVTKLSADGKSLVYSTYLGGSVQDGGVAIAIDNSGSAYVLGRTSSPDFPVRNEFLKAIPGTHAFVTKLSPDGSTLAYSTWLGGTAGSELYWSNGQLIFSAPGGIAVDQNGHAWVAGATSSADFPITVDAFQPRRAAGAFSNAFISELSADGSALLYSSFLGGPGSAGASALALSAPGNAYVAGLGGMGFPVINPLPGGLNGGAFVAKFGVGTASPGMPQIGGVTNVDGAAAVAPGSWIVIKGTNLSSATRDWTGEIDNAGDLPTQLAATTVTVNGKPAYIYYVSPTQINAIAPDDGTVGMAPVVAAVNGIASPPFSVQLNRFSPALFLWPQNYVVATHLDYSVAVKNGVLPGTTTTPAAQRETIVLWGSGLGPVTPAAPAGMVTQTSGFVQTPVNIHFGAITQPAVAVALTEHNAAVYQIAVTVPGTLTPGDYSIGIEINGSVTATGKLTVGPM
jgi:uncharacterized protein (TIGR03437 family)